MNTRRTNSILWGTAAALGCAAVGVAATGLLLPLDGRSDDEADVVRQAGPATRTASAGGPGLPPLESFAPVWTARLRRPFAVAETSPPASVVPTPAAVRSAATAADQPPPPLTLVGTIGDALALLRAPDGSVEVRAVGESVAAATVLAVRPAQVDLRYNGRLVTLRRPADSPEPDPLRPSATPPSVPPTDPPAAADLTPPTEPPQESPPAEAANVGGP